MRGRPFAAIAVALMVASAPAAAKTMLARETADVGARGTGSIGVFNPATYAVRDGIELRTQPLLFLVAPNALLRVRHRNLGGFRLAGEYGLSIPTVAMRLAQGHLFPSWDEGGGRIGWSVVPRAGLLASHGDPTSRVVTVAIDVAIGVPLTGDGARPTETYAPLELLLAPALRGFRAHAGVLYDVGGAPHLPRLRARSYADLYVQGGERDRPYATNSLAWKVDRTSFVGRAGMGADIALGCPRNGRFHQRLTFGFAVWVYDQHQINPDTFERRVSIDVFPTLDFIWEK